VLDPNLAQRVEADAHELRASSMTAQVVAPVAHSLPSLCPHGLPRCPPGSAAVDEDSAGPEVYFGTEEFFYNNLELLFSEYNNV
jgi:hypothetical protein